jgi:hypothetical protein
VEPASPTTIPLTGIPLGCDLSWGPISAGASRTMGYPARVRAATARERISASGWPSTTRFAENGNLRFGSRVSDHGNAFRLAAGFPELEEVPSSVPERSGAAAGPPVLTDETPGPPIKR